MAIFGQYQGGDYFNVAGNMRDILKGQQSIQDNMLGALEKYNTARQEMDQLQAVAGSILGQYKVDEKGNPDPTAPKYVHDMFKAVNKEGGLANMSKSQMLAGIKAYETGYGLEQQKLQQDAARENIRGANIANTAREIELKRIQEAEADRLRIKEAQKATQSEIDKLSKTKIEKSTKTVPIEYQGEKIELSVEEVSPFYKIINNPKSTPQEKEDAKRGIELLVYNKSKYSKKSLEQYDPYGVGGEVTAESEIVLEGRANPQHKPFVSAYDKIPDGPKEVTGVDSQGRRTYAGVKNPTFNKTVIDSYISREADKFNKATAEEDSFAKREKELALEEARIENVAGTPELARIEKEQADIQRRLNYERDLLKNGAIFVYPETGQVTRFPFSGKEKIEQERKVLNLQNQLIKIQGQYSRESNKIVGKLVSTEKAVRPDPYKPSAINFGSEIIEEERTVTKEVQRSLYEQTDDEYSLMVNYLKANGGVPASFTKDAFYASKGILRPTIMPLGNGQTYVKMGGLEQIVKDQNVSSNLLPIIDQKRLHDAKQLGIQSNMNGLNVNGYSFSGQLRVGDIDQANKVRDGVFKTTRALAAVDQMISIAENASMFDKLMPTEVSGIAQSLTNAAQAANRTEIGGSGSWSNQDQIYMDKVIRDPSSGFNTLFSSQTIASLKEYRRRLETSLHDSGTVYGFAFEKGGRNNADGLDSQRQQFRVLFHSYLAQGLSKEEALQRAISDSEADYE